MLPFLEPWGEPVNLGPPVNTDADDFCPTIAHDGKTLFFVSRKQVGVQGVDWCGAGDMYVALPRHGGGFREPENLGCQVNSSADEFSPFPIEERGRGMVLYFSSMRAGLGAGGDLYVSKRHGGIFQSAELVPGVNTEFDDGQPNLRRDGLEMFFYSNRPDAEGQGGNDIYVARRESVHGPWLASVNLGAKVNSPASETRPSLSWNGKELYFGSNRPESDMGSSDIYLTTRERRLGKGF